MTTQLTWEEHTRAQLERAKEQGQRAHALLDYWSQRRSALEKVLELAAQEIVILQNGKAATTLAELRNMSVNDSTKVIARQSAGFLVTKDAAKTLVQAGVFGSIKEARENIYTTIRRSADFERVRRGVYRLLRPDEVKPQPQVSPQSSPQRQGRISGDSRLVDKVEIVRRDHPDWTRAQVREYLIQAGWNFGTSNSAFAVSGAFAALAGRGKHKPRQPRQTALLPQDSPTPQAAVA